LWSASSDHEDPRGKNAKAFLNSAPAEPGRVRGEAQKQVK